MQLVSDKEHAVNLFTSSISKRQAKAALVRSAISLAEGMSVYGKIIDLLSIYRGVLELRDSLPNGNMKRCDIFLNEIEDTLRYFVDHKVLRERKIRIADI